MLILIAFLAIFSSCKKDEEVTKSSSNNTYTGGSITPIEIKQDIHYVAPTWGYVNVNLQNCLGIKFIDVTTGAQIITNTTNEQFIIEEGHEYYFDVNCLEAYVNAYFIAI